MSWGFELFACLGLWFAGFGLFAISKSIDELVRTIQIIWKEAHYGQDQH